MAARAPTEVSDELEGVSVTARHERRRGRSKLIRGNLLPLVGLFLLGWAFLAPTLIHGWVFGPIDLLNQFGLGHHSSAPVHNIVDSDLVQQDLPWYHLEWTDVHRGALPLWNPYSGEGMPVAANFVASAFSVPTLVSYLFPVQFGMVVSVIVKLFIAGSGAYVLGRTIGLRRLPSFMVGILFELCGAFCVWLGWSQTGVMAWAGWLFAAAILVVEGESRRTRGIAALGVVFALSIYGGHPESSVILTLSSLLFAIVLAIGRVTKGRRWPQLASRIGDLALGYGIGLGLSAPLWIPGLKVASATARFQGSGFGALPGHDLLNLIFQGFDGLPISGRPYVSPGNYYEVTAFVGIIPLALATVALIRRWRSPYVRAFGILVAVILAVLFVPPVLATLDHLPHVGGIDWYRSLMPLSLAIAALSGLGLEAMLTEGESKGFQSVFGGTFVFGAIMLAVIAVWSYATRNSLPPLAANMRAKSFFWPAVGCVTGLVAYAALVVSRRRQAQDRLRVKRAKPRTSLALGCATALVVVESCFLVLSGAPLWTAAQPYFPMTPGESTLVRVVGTNTVGTTTCPSPYQFPNLGLLPESNVVYRIHELNFYDTPVAPRGYYTSWSDATRTTVPPNPTGALCFAIANASLARRYGVRYLLAPSTGAGPRGATYVETIAGERLYSVPGAADATLAALGGPNRVQAKGVGQPVRVVHPNDATWQMTVTAKRPSVLYLRLTDVPGWSASVDGRPASLHTWDSVMQEMTIPPGRHSVVLTYWPEGMTTGFIIAGGVIIALICALVASLFVRNRMPAEPDERHGRRHR